MYQLTNQQRAYFGLPPLQESWKTKLLPADKYRPNSILVFDGDTLKRQIISTDDVYKEYQLAEETRNQEFLLPKTDKGKATRLTASSIEKRTPIDTYLIVDRASGILIGNFANQRTFYDSSWEDSAGEKKNSIASWVTNFIDGCPEQHLGAVAAFSNTKRQHCKFKAGDYFRFKMGHEEFGFGRILLDIAKLRKAKLLPEHHGFHDLMGRPVLIKLYAYISRATSVDIEAIERSPSLPSDYIFDNKLYYGDYEVIAHKDINEDEYDFPISYRRSTRGNSKVYLHWGLIHIEIPESIFANYLRAENPFASKGGQIAFSDNPYSRLSLGHQPRYSATTIRNAYHRRFFDYEATWGDYFELRNPKNARIKKEIFEAFGLLEMDTYTTAARRRKLPTLRELHAKI